MFLTVSSSAMELQAASNCRLRLLIVSHFLSFPM